jgi:hypothetical protein
MNSFDIAVSNVLNDIPQQFGDECHSNFFRETIITLRFLLNDFRAFFRKESQELLILALIEKQTIEKYLVFYRHERSETHSYDSRFCSIEASRERRL